MASAHDPSDLSTTLAYHERTKHRPGRFATSLGYLDWATQPDPFLRYRGAQQLQLATVHQDEGPRFDDVMHGVWPEPSSLDHRSLSSLLYDSLALSAWKVAGASRWALRVNPSSGNLHPTEAYVLAGPANGLADHAGLYHYAPREHALELRARIPAPTWRELSLGLPDNTLLLGLTSIPWREAWKYGERAFRYCQHDIGHAIGAVGLAAAMLGWRCRVVESVTDDNLARLLGIAGDRGEERQVPECLLWLSPAMSGNEHQSFRVSDTVLDVFDLATWEGAPNALSPAHHRWPLIEEVEVSTRRGAASVAATWHPAAPERRRLDPPRPILARRLVRQRRSAVAMDGTTGIDRDAFYRIARRLLPSADHPMFSALPWRPSVHLAIFVHRVTGLASGLYVLVREGRDRAALRAETDEAFDWTAPPGRPADLDLWCLQENGTKDLSRAICCHQDIASDGAFALGMLARFQDGLEEAGPWFYRRLLWECGVLGQALYLEAEAEGIRGTGIGCFFDDAMHEVLGMTGRSFQSLYHFTIGGPVEDARLQTEPAYAHLDGERVG